MSTGPSVFPRWLPAAVVVAWSVAGLVFALLWQLEVGALREERRSRAILQRRFGSVCGLVKSDLAGLSARLKRTPDSFGVKQEGHQALLRAYIASTCLGPAGLTGGPETPDTVVIWDLTQEPLLRRSIDALSAWADWYAAALAASEAKEWSRREWERDGG